MRELVMSYQERDGVRVQRTYEHLDDFMEDVRRGGCLNQKLDLKNVVATFFDCDLLGLEFSTIKDLCDYCSSMNVQEVFK